jgi:hypothetical protein
VTEDQLQARMQRIEADVRGLHEKVGVLAAVDSGGAKKRIADTFSAPRTVIIYRGLKAGMTQAQIASSLKERGLTKGAQQQQVSATIRELEDLGFVEKTPRGKYVATAGWETFGLEKVLRKTLRDGRVDDLF